MDENQKNPQEDKKLNDLRNSARLIANAFQLISGSEFRGYDASAIAETLKFLDSLHGQTSAEIAKRENELGIGEEKQEGAVETQAPAEVPASA